MEHLGTSAPLAESPAGDAIRRDGDSAEPSLASDTGRAYPIGSVLGSYRLLQQIGAGGMGRVFIAEHIRLGRRVALKVLRSEYSGNREAVQRFFSEARAVNCINHENIIEVSDFIEHSPSVSFYIMELLSGTDLRGLENREGVVPLRRALDIAVQVCRGVGAAHDAGVIHRDLKPDNIFLIERGGRRDFVKLLDFGVAKLTNDELDEASSCETSAGLVVGTPDYMAPEQAYGQSVDNRCDIYSLGVILFEMVTGRRPFLGRTAREVMVQHMMQEPPRPSQINPNYDLSAELEDLIMECLRKNPEDRPQNMKDIEGRLAAIAEQAPRSVTRLYPSIEPPRQSRSRRWLSAAGVTLLIASGGIFAWSQGFRPDIPVAQADGLVGALRRVTPASLAGESTGAASAPGEVAALSQGRDQLTIDPTRDGKAPPRQAVARETAPALAPAPVTTPVIAASPATSPAPARATAAIRRKSLKLDRESVINPFE